MLVSKIDLGRVSINALCATGKLSAVRYCLERGVEVDCGAIWWAAFKDHLEVVKELIAYKAPVDEKAIFVAAYYGHLEIVRELIKYKAPVDEDAIKNAKTEELSDMLREYAKG